jgi:hypothetical protein
MLPFSHRLHSDSSQMWGGWGQGPVQASQVLPHWPRQTISVWTSLCAQGNYHAETGPYPNCCHKVGCTDSSRMSLYAVPLRFPFTGTKGPSLNHETLPAPMHYAAFSRHPPNPDSSVGLPDGEVWFITPENVFPLLQSPMVVSFTPLQLTLGITHGDIRLVCSCSAMETNLMMLPTNSSCADVASRGSLELGSECCNW